MTEHRGICNNRTRTEMARSNRDTFLVFSIFPSLRHSHLRDVVKSAIDCIVTSEKGLYISSELTTGRNLYDLLRAHHTESRNDFINKYGLGKWRTLYRDLTEKNIIRSIEFQQRVAKRNKKIFIINPCRLKIKNRNFTQRYYMLIWEAVIREKISKIYFNYNWQYSAGCLFEYVVAEKLNLDKYYMSGRLSKTLATKMIHKAFNWLMNNGLKISHYNRIYNYYVNEFTHKGRIQ